MYKAHALCGHTCCVQGAVAKQISCTDSRHGLQQKQNIFDMENTTVASQMDAHYYGQGRLQQGRLLFCGCGSNWPHCHVCFVSVSRLCAFLSSACRALLLCKGLHACQSVPTKRSRPFPGNFQPQLLFQNLCAKKVVRSVVCGQGNARTATTRIFCTTPHILCIQ